MKNFLSRNYLIQFGIVLFFLLPFFLQAQDSHYDTDLLSKEFHRSRREEVRKQMPNNSVAVFFTSPEKNRSNDIYFAYHQEPNFYYLSGYTEPNAVLLIFKEKQKIGKYLSDEFIFIPQKNLYQETWTGKRLDVESIEHLLGFKAVLLTNDFDTLVDFKKLASVLHLPFPEGLINNKKDKTNLYNLVEQCKKKINTEYSGQKLFSIMASLREVKTAEELWLLRKAIDITVLAEKELMKSVDSTMTEYQAQGIAEYIFKKNGAEQPAFPSIIGGGENSCILHYTTNRKKLTEKDILVVDIGAEYHGYAADVTRTIPVSGKFSEEEKAIYQIVSDAQQASIAQCKAGNPFSLTYETSFAVIAKGLLRLGIIQKEEETKRYFMHGTSHHLGLDVHDITISKNFAAGNVITVEPGIYIPSGSPCDSKWWNIGVRIEDDVLITENGCEVLSQSAPRTIEEIEALMQQSSIFNQQKKH